MVKLPQVVWVEWVDASGGGGWTGDLREVQWDKDLRCWSAGFLLKSTRDRIVITTAISALNHAMDVLEIPRGAIKKIVNLGGVPVQAEKSA